MKITNDEWEEANEFCYIRDLLHNKGGSYGKKGVRTLSSEEIVEGFVVENTQELTAVVWLREGVVWE